MNTSDVREILERVASRERSVMLALRAIKRERAAYKALIKAQRTYDRAITGSDDRIADAAYNVESVAIDRRVKSVKRESKYSEHI